MAYWHICGTVVCPQVCFFVFLNPEIPADIENYTSGCKLRRYDYKLLKFAHPTFGQLAAAVGAAFASVLWYELVKAVK